MKFFLLYILIMSIITFVVYSIDKVKAAKDMWRIPEKTLLIFSLIGGVYGALIAMYKIRHKNRKMLFIVTNWSLAVIYIVIGTLITVNIGW